MIPQPPSPKRKLLTECDKLLNAKNNDSLLMTLTLHHQVNETSTLIFVATDGLSAYFATKGNNTLSKRKVSKDTTMSV